MKNIFMMVAGLGLVLVVGFYVLNAYIYNEKQAQTVTDFKDATFYIDNQWVTINEAPNIESKMVTRYFGNELYTDLNGDGVEDVAFIVTQEGGGSGTFYYAVGAIMTENGYAGTEGYLLGDRIAPQSTQVSPNPRHKNVVVFNYADRAVGEPMTTQPSVGKSVYLKLVPDSMLWAIVEQDFEGESNLPDENKKHDLIVVTQPSKGATVTNPVIVTGEARGTWFFEASFPLVVVDWDGRIIGEGYATAEGDWMTEDFVPFTGTVQYDLPEDTPYKRGAIIFAKDNPSGLPEHDDALEISILFE